MSFSWPILSTITFLPLLGALLIVALRARDEAVDRNARYIALWTTLVTFALSLLLWRDFDPDHGAVPVRRAARLARADQIPYGRRRYFLAVRSPHHAAHAALHPRELAVDHGSGCANIRSPSSCSRH